MAATARPGRAKGDASRRRPGPWRPRAASGPYLLARLAALACLLAACSPTFDWREVHPAPGGFTIALPQRPRTEQRDIALGDPAIAIRVPVTMTSSGVGPTLFAIEVAVLPPGGPVPSQWLAWIRDGVVRNIHGTVVGEKPIAAPPGRSDGLRIAEEVAARGTMAGEKRPTRLDARIYVFDDRLYSLTALYAEGELTPELLDTFFESFRIVDRS